MIFFQITTTTEKTRLPRQGVLCDGVRDLAVRCFNRVKPYPGWSVTRPFVLVASDPDWVSVNPFAQPLDE